MSKQMTAEELVEDAELQRIEAMSDDEVDAELRSVGIDPDDVVKKTKAVLALCQERVKDKARIAELEGALSEIANWPNGGNRYGQQNIKDYAKATLQGSEVEG